MQEELAQLRAELDRLRERERELLQELFDIRAAAEIQNKKIDDIIKTQPVAATDRLPTEVFSRIIHFALQAVDHREYNEQYYKKQEFAGVSRRWRDVILSSPSLWATICLGPGESSSRVKTHVARSREHPLDIIFLRWYAGDNDGCLDLILRCTHRWHSLTFYSTIHPLWLGPSASSFPCLKHVNIQSEGYHDVKFLSADNTPVLEQLVLATVRLPVISLPSLEKLTTLKLYGMIGHWQLELQTIHLLLLRSLTIYVDNPNQLLKAIVAPELSHFNHRGPELHGVPSVFDGLPSAFNKVHYLSLWSLTEGSIAMACRVFPNVRHLKLGRSMPSVLFGLLGKTDLWGDLECVTFHSLPVDVVGNAAVELAEWLQQQHPTAKPLHVRFTRIERHCHGETTGHLLSTLYDSLHEKCTFEVDGFPFMERMKMTSLTRTLRMDLPHVPSNFVNMCLGQDVSWRKSTDDSPEYEFSDSEADDGHAC